MFPGGKGANQAVAAARLEGMVSFISSIGADIFGDEALVNLANHKIGTEFINREESSATGIAQIVVSASGQNEIIVASGANLKLEPKHVFAAAELFQKADIILAQLEIPMNAVEAVAEQARKYQRPLIINPAPAQKLSERLLSGLFLITPNETEASVLTGECITTVADAEKAATLLQNRGVENVIITMGASGALYKGPDNLFFIKANKVNALDTTGAGDTFNGALAVALAEKKSWRSAIQFATDAAGIAVTRMGAQTSMPSRQELINS